MAPSGVDNLSNFTTAIITTTALMVPLKFQPDNFSNVAAANYFNFSDQSLQIDNISDYGRGSGKGEDDSSSSQTEIEIYCKLASQIISNVIDLFNTADNSTIGDDDDGGYSSSQHETSWAGKKNKRKGNATKEQLIANECAAGKFQYNAKSLPSIILLTIAASFVLFLIFTQLRKRARRRICGGRPGLLNPFPINQPCRFRLIYIAFWAMVSYDGIQIVSGGSSQLFINTKCADKWEAAIIVLINIHIFAVLYFPIIGAMSTDTPLGYMIATAWTWALSLIRGFQLADDLTDSAGTQLNDNAAIAIHAFSHAVPVVSMIFLSIAFPIRLVIGLYFTYIGKRFSMYEPLKTEPPFLSSDESLYVRELFKPPQPPIERKGIKKLLDYVDKIYKNVPYFRYSQNVLSAICIGAIFIYYIVLLDVYVLVLVGEYAVPVFIVLVDFQTAAFFVLPAVQKMVLKAANQTLDSGIIEQRTRRAIDIGESHVWCIFYSNVTVLLLVGIIQTYLVVSLLKTYRTDRLRAQRGVYRVLNHPNKMSARGIIGGAVRYMGFQAVMFAWGIIIQIFLFTVVGVVIGMVIILPLTYGYGDWVIKFVIAIIPALGVTIGLAIIQQLAVAFCFTAVPCGRILAVDNPRGYSNYAYLSFFKSLFVGLVNALMRLIMSVVLGAIIFSRLDMPTVTPKFKQLDYGFQTYEALIHLENAHMHPVLVSFVNLILDRIKSQADERRALKAKLHREAVRQVKTRRAIRVANTLGQNTGEVVVGADDVEVMFVDIEAEFADAIEADRKRRCILFKWLLLRTLACNPKMTIERKMALHLDQFQIREKRLPAALPTDFSD